MDILRLLGKDQYDAAMGAASPSAANVFATINDLSGLGDNIYTVDGVLTGARIVDLAANNLEFDTGAGGKMVVSATPGGPPATKEMDIYTNSTGAFIEAKGVAGPGGTPLRIIGGTQPGVRGISLETPDNITQWYGSNNTQALIHDASAVNTTDKTATWRDLSGTVAYLTDITGAADSIYTNDGSIPAATTRTVTIADDSVVTFTAPTFGTILSLDGATGKVTIPGLLDPTGLELSSTTANPSASQTTFWAKTGDLARPYWGDTEKLALFSDLIADDQTLSDVLGLGNSTGANNISVNEGQSIVYNTAAGGPFTGNLSGPTLTGNVTWTLPVGGGTLALLTDIPAELDGIYTADGTVGAANRRVLLTDKVIFSTTALLGGIVINETSGTLPNKLSLATGGTTTVTGVDRLTLGAAVANGQFHGGTLTNDGIIEVSTRLSIGVGAAQHFVLSSAGVVVRGLTDLNLFDIDYSADKVGIGEATPASKLTVSGGDAEVTGGTNGVILEDRTSGTRYRVYIDSTGTLFTEAA